MICELARLEHDYTSGRIGTGEYTNAMSRLVLASLRKRKKSYPITGRITEEDVAYFRVATPEELTAALYSDGILKR